MMLVDPVIPATHYIARVWRTERIYKNRTKRIKVMTLEVVSGSDLRALELVRDYLNKNGIHFTKIEIRGGGSDG